MEKTVELCQKLRKFQHLLKREALMKDYHNKVISELTKSISQSHAKILLIQKLIYTYHMYSMNNSGLQQPQEFFNSLCTPITFDNDNIPFLVDSSSSLTQFMQFSNFLNTKLKFFAKICVKLVQNDESCIDMLTFSTVPSVFKYFTVVEQMQRYKLFIKEVVGLDQNIAEKLIRVIFLTIPYKIFMNKVIFKNTEALFKLLINLESSSNQFVEKFSSRWDDCAEYCPSYILEILNLFNKPNITFVNTFLRPAFENLRLYGIVQYDIKISSKQNQALVSAICSKSDSLLQSLRNVQVPTTLPSIGELPRVLPFVYKSTLLSFEDFQMLNELALLDQQANINAEILPPEIDQSLNTGKYSLFYVTPDNKLAHRKSFQELKLSMEDDVEIELRNILSEVSMIPKGANLDLVPLLHFHIQVAQEDQRLHFETKLEDFEKAQKRSKKEWTFTELLALLQSHFSQREESRNNLMAEITIHNQIHNILQTIFKQNCGLIGEHATIFQYQLIDKWVTENRPIQFITDDLVLDPTKFSQYFDNFVDQFDAWMKTNHYSIQVKNEILHTLIMTEIPLERFNKLRPNYQKIDIACYKTLKKSSSSLLKSNFEEWMKPIVTSPSLIQSSLNLLSKVFSSKTPIEKCKFLGKVMKKLIFVTSQIVPDEDIGANHLVPLLIHVVLTVNPQQLQSNIAYIDHFVFIAMRNVNTIHRLGNVVSEGDFRQLESVLNIIKEKFPKIDPNFKK